jgi:hypothetical protein
MSERARWTLLDAAIKLGVLVVVVVSLVYAATSFSLVDRYLNGFLAGGFATYLLHKYSSPSRCREFWPDVALLGVIVVNALLDKHVVETFIGAPIGTALYLCAKLILTSPMMVRHEENRPRHIWARGRD